MIRHKLIPGTYIILIQIPQTQKFPRDSTYQTTFQNFGAVTLFYKTKPKTELGKTWIIQHASPHCESSLWAWSAYVWVNAPVCAPPVTPCIPAPGPAPAMLTRLTWNQMARPVVSEPWHRKRFVAFELSPILRAFDDYGTLLRSGQKLDKNNVTLELFSFGLCLVCVSEDLLWTTLQYRRIDLGTFSGKHAVCR